MLFYMRWWERETEIGRMQAYIEVKNQHSDQDFLQTVQIVLNQVILSNCQNSAFEEQ